ncbi:MAG: hypothetical protein B1H11_13065 [Desulfobacteraceae bacterium 4484_190.1]|nr:MAG: hypothetical protein B1H11_13065 [Desulfobacteraceae bacterium 4484_190.1]
MKTNPLRRYLRAGSLPHFFCSGCGAAQVMNFFLRAADEINLDFDRLVAIGGVGCAARIPVYIHADALHGIHGRTLPWATGIKLHNPDLKVVIFAGDGDAVAEELRTMTTPYGNPEPRFDICRLAMTAGATFVSRWNTYRSRQTINAIKKALQHKGFSLVEIVSQCPTNFGRRAVGTGDPVKCLQWIEEHSVTIEEARKLSGRELRHKFILGNFVEEQRPVFEGSSIYAVERGG